MPGINKIKKVNLSKKDKSKILLILRKTNERNIYLFIKKTTTNNQDLRLIVCLWSVDTTFIFLEKLFIKSLVAKIKWIVALRIFELLFGLTHIIRKRKVCVKTLLVFSNRL